jgi:xanthine dehydrogenase YagR molybdenum-binding subunit
VPAIAAPATQECGSAAPITYEVDGEQFIAVSAYVGGGFGSKLSVHSETILAAIAARRLNRSVKVAHGSNCGT